MTEKLKDALERIADASVMGLNVATATEALNAVRAIAKTALDTTPDPAVNSGAVKALEWKNRHKNPLRDNDLISDTVCGQYVIRPSSSGKRFRLWLPDMPYEKAGVHSTVESAKTDAQSDYERRILSALSTPPQEAGEAETPAPQADVVCEHEWFDCSNSAVQAPTKSCKKCGWTVHGEDAGIGMFIVWPWMDSAPKHDLASLKADVEASFRRHMEAAPYAADLIKRMAFEIVPMIVHTPAPQPRAVGNDTPSGDNIPCSVCGKDGGGVC